MHEIIEKITTRHTIRCFQQRQIEDEVLEQILQAGLYAPSAGNNQRARIVVCQDPEINLELGKLNRSAFFEGMPAGKTPKPVSSEQPSIRDDLTIMNGFYGAPTVLTIFALDMQYSHDDAAMIAENVMLAAHFLDVGSCYVGRADKTFDCEYGQNLRKKWGIEDDLIPVCHVCLGYREGPVPNAKPRKPERIIFVKQ